MSNIVIDESTCIKCGCCVEECPSDVLVIEEERLKVIQPQFCISCGHCAAICPKGAIISSAHNQQQPFIIQQIPENLRIDKLLFHKKRSIRAFNNETLDKAHIEQLIQYAEKAPSSHNLRNRSYLVITKKEDIDAIKTQIVKYCQFLVKLLNPLTLTFISVFNKPAYHELSEYVLAFKHVIHEYNSGHDKIFRHSKCIVCIAAPTGSPHSKDDCLAAQHYMMLFGKTLDIDSFIVGYAQNAHKVIEKHFKLEKGYSIFSISAFGFGKYVYSKEIFYKTPEIKWR